MKGMLAMNKGQKIWRWDLEKRIRFQTMLQQGYTLTTIQSIWKENNIYSESPTISALSKEVRLGLTDEEAESKRYVKYDVVKAYRNILGEGTLDWLIDNAEKKKH